MQRSHVPTPLTGLAALAVLLVVLGAANAAGSGYDLSFSQAPPIPIADAALIDLLTNDPGGNNITVTISVDGVFVLNSSAYSYSLFFGGGAEENATAYVDFSNNSTRGTYVTLATGVSPAGSINATLSNGDSELTFSISKAVLGGSSTDFVANARASYSTPSTDANSYIGSYYGSGDSGSCTGAGCATSTPSPGTPFDWWIVIVPVVVVIAVVAIVLVLVSRRKPPADASPATATSPSTPPSTPPP
jgi:hypothetical protein